MINSNEYTRQLTLSCLVSLGVSYLLKSEEKCDVLAASVVTAYLKIEHLNSVTETSLEKVGDILHILCNHCSYCLKTIESRELSLCSGCRMYAYCSDTCQKNECAEWKKKQSSYLR